MAVVIPVPVVIQAISYFKASDYEIASDLYENIRSILYVIEAQGYLGERNIVIRSEPKVYSGPQLQAILAMYQHGSNRTIKEGATLQSVARTREVYRSSTSTINIESVRVSPR